MLLKKIKDQISNTNKTKTSLSKGMKFQHILVAVFNNLLVNCHWISIGNSEVIAL